MASCILIWLFLWLSSRRFHGWCVAHMKDAEQESYMVEMALLCDSASILCRGIGSVFDPLFDRGGTL